MNLHNQILLSRLLTRSGDQAWDFALPVTLVMLFPKNFSLVATIYFLTKVGQFLFQPTLAGVVDRWKRSHTAYLGTVLQLLSVLGAALCLYGLAQTVSSNTHATLTTIEWALIVGVTTASIVSSLGSGLMDIAVGNDWIPTLVSAEDLARVNSRLKQIDLSTEVLSPVLAGILLAMNTLASPLFGFSLVVFGMLSRLCQKFFCCAGFLHDLNRFKHCNTVPLKKWQVCCAEQQKGGTIFGNILLPR